jgi:hypothetical protein
VFKWTKDQLFFSLLLKVCVLHINRFNFIKKNSSLKFIQIDTNCLWIQNWMFFIDLVSFHSLILNFLISRIWALVQFWNESFLNTTFEIIVVEMRQKYNSNNYFLLFCYLITILLLYGSELSNANSDLSDSTNWDQIFSLRNKDDWKQLWHKEKHRRCYQELLVHMEWVCDKDIYKLRRKRDLIEGRNWEKLNFVLLTLKSRLLSIPYSVEPLNDETFLSSKKANMFGILRFKKANRRRQYKRGIIDECCQADAGCSWEEYAEYCPANRRIRT